MNAYSDYPNGSNIAPTAVASGTLDNTAVFGTASQGLGPADVNQAGGLSPFGIMGMGGNVFEWEETDLDLVNDSTTSTRGVRGGGWGNTVNSFSSSIRSVVGIPTAENANIGFRVVSLSSAVPEPSSLVLTCLGIFACMFARGPQSM